MIKDPPLTLTFEPLLGEPPQQRPAVFTEGGTFVVVDFKPVGHVDFEALLVDLQENQHTMLGSCHFWTFKSSRKAVLDSRWMVSLYFFYTMGMFLHSFMVLSTWTLEASGEEKFKQV